MLQSRTGNVLIGEDGIPILAESGIPQLIEDLRLGSYGHADDVRLLAPEVLAGGPFTTASDVYAFACIGFGKLQVLILNLN